MIIEGLLTTKNAAGQAHVAPMGPQVNEELSEWLLRPFVSSTTFGLLRQHASCVFHVHDDVLPIVQAALSLPLELDFEQHPSGDWIIANCCHWYRLEVTQWNLAAPRTEATAKVLQSGVKRPFWGWNRAKHAVLEATILATRLHLADKLAIADDLAKLELIVEKTAGPREWLAWNTVKEFIATSK